MISHVWGHCIAVSSISRMFSDSSCQLHFVVGWECYDLMNLNMLIVYLTIFWRVARVIANTWLPNAHFGEKCIKQQLVPASPRYGKHAFLCIFGIINVYAKLSCFVCFHLFHWYLWCANLVFVLSWSHDCYLVLLLFNQMWLWCAEPVEVSKPCFNLFLHIYEFTPICTY